MLAEKKLINSLQVKYRDFTSRLSHNLTLPERKFMKDITFGIIQSQSCIARKISQSLHEKVSLKKTQERLIYHLDKEDLAEKVNHNLLELQCRKLNKNSLILVDPSDIVKKYAEKMDGLSRVRDGNDKKWKTGYEVLDIVGVNTSQETPSIIPIHSQLHSNEIGLDTMKNKILDKIIDIIIPTNNSSTFVFDRGFDDKKVIKELHLHEASYIIRMKKNRTIFFNGLKRNIDEVARSLKLRYTFKYNEDKVTIKADSIPIQIPLDGYPKKHPEFANTNLIVAEISSKKKNGKTPTGIFYHISSNPNFVGTERAFVKFGIESYRLRWKIEEVHRQIKTDFKWEDMQLLRFNRLQFMNTMLWVAISYLYDLDSWKYRFANIFSNLMLEKKSKLIELKKFIYYRIAKVVIYCFSQFKIKRLKYFKSPRKNEDQLCLTFE